MKDLRVLTLLLGAIALDSQAAPYRVGSGGGSIATDKGPALYDFHVFNIEIDELVFQEQLAKQPINSEDLLVFQSRLGPMIPSELLLQKISQISATYPNIAKYLLSGFKERLHWSFSSLKGSVTQEYLELEFGDAADISLVAVNSAGLVTIDPDAFQQLSSSHQVGLLIHEAFHWEDEMPDLATKKGTRYIVFRTACLFDETVFHEDFGKCEFIMPIEEAALSRSGS